jgi:diadenylate cyclase
MNSFLSDFARSVQFADVMDVLLVSVFFFIGISWLRRSSSGSAARRIMALGLLLAIVYMLADLVHLFLVRQVLQLLLLGFLVAAVVVFQSDIRRLLDHIGSWGSAESRYDEGGGPAVETLLEVANRLSDDHIGAIIALRGRDSWESYVQGGVELDGVVSRPLLESIFQPESAGHDGAVLMEGDRVVRFAVHLPLAAHIPEVSRYGGTRHAAALGLADECDAFVLVVSEERGSISVAEQGRLMEMESLSDLAGRLTTFWNRHYGEAATAERWWSRTTLETTAMSLGLASLIWLLFSYSADTISRTFEVPIEFRNLPPEWALDSDTVPSALVTLTGSERAFGRLDSNELAISFDLTDPDSGLNVLTVSGAHLALPSGLRIANVNPREVRVQAHPQIAVELPVLIRTLQPLPDSFSLVPQPRTVTILVSQAAEVPARVPTVPIDLSRLLPTGSVTASLDLPEGARLPPDDPGEVTVTLRRGGVSPAR